MVNPLRRAVALAVPILLAFAPSADGAVEPDGAMAGAACASSFDARGLTSLFAGDIGRVVGADYQRAFRLPDGRVLWLFQDAFIRNSPSSVRLVHNIGMVQRGRCFRVLRSGTVRNPKPWIGAAATTPERHWFWPLAGLVAGDGTFRLFLAEMVEHGPRYLSHTEPVATWLATITLPDLSITRLRPARNSSGQLYGWSVAGDDEHTYLYGHCYRQFGWGPFPFGHHPCAAFVKVARVPKGEPNALPSYWNGRSWSRRPGRAVNIAPLRAPSGERRAVNPMQIAYTGRCWIAVTKEGDWFGDTIYLDSARTPTGPWRTTSVIPARPLGEPSVYNTFFASFIRPTTTPRIIGLSNNRWDGVLSDNYRPTFRGIRARRWSPCGG